MTNQLESSKPKQFIREAAGPSGLVGVFEDDGDTGYLYIYEPEGGGVLNHLHIYDRKPELDIQEADVEVEWSTDLSKCGVRIWSKMRGIIDVVSKQEGRAWLENRQTPGIGDPKWLAGFNSK